jgi:hypothetical protein
MYHIEFFIFQEKQNAVVIYKGEVTRYRPGCGPEDG